MIKKIVLILTVILMVACSSNQQVVRTSRPVYTKKSTPVVQRVKKPIYRPTTVKKPTQQVAQNSSKQPVLKPSVSKQPESKPAETNQDNNSSNTIEILEATTRVKVTTQMVLTYIEKYKEIAKDNMLKNGIPSSITLGQAILESGAGTGPLSVQANNHFGIKCHVEWNGPSIRYTDDEENECFRKYDDPSLSFKDHSYFLASRPRYASLFQLDKTDYKAWAIGLKAAGYATDPKYPDKLIALIERYELNRFDSEVLGKSYVPKNTIAMDSTATHQVTKGDTLYSISKKYNLTIEELKRKNSLNDNSLSLGQSLIVK
jgi:flagellum-specific peptidoglycan hydrolase FlgJ